MIVTISNLSGNKWIKHLKPKHHENEIPEYWRTINDKGANTPLVPTTYNTNNKHLLKLYHNANHGWGNLSDIVIDGVRTDAIRWLDGHK